MYEWRNDWTNEGNTNQQTHDRSGIDIVPTYQQQQKQKQKHHNKQNVIINIVIVVAFVIIIIINSLA